MQAKGHRFDLTSLLGGDRAAAARFHDGLYATIYLSPRDYHRVHLPLAGTLDAMTFVPGELFSVSEATTQLVPGLFARNERVVCYFETALGPLAVIDRRPSLIAGAPRCRARRRGRSVPANDWGI